MQQLINVQTGEFTLDNNFTISPSTTLKDLREHFGEDRLKKSGYIAKIDDLYFLFYFSFENGLLKRINFEIEEGPEERNPWGNNRDFETNWIARQMGDNSGFVWDMNEAGRHYHLSYKWGSVGVYYDFKNGTFESTLVYKNPG